ncbi:alpha-ketoglutarate-dependent dioxygenase alkB homolog 7, mitochondrial [Hetaerina americana]|uniref:alpha-ketoglutarate-dependent dioxygenase alkB homolog 7, mitochondrial n=1 Tax=Hetaerina americana TaxID=62018 RepID=UPI003A7F1301
MVSVMILRAISLSKSLSSSCRICCRRNISSAESKYAVLIQNDQWHKYLSFSDGFDKESRLQFSRDLLVVNNFVTDGEEKSLMEELTPVLKKMHYEFDHWDDAIHGYRETERLNWNPNNMKIIDRVRKIAFPSETSHIPLVHVLDLAEKGFIKPHIDSVRFCGDIIAGLSLLSSSIMRLVHENEKSKYVDVLLQRRSLYIMTGTARYDFTHELLDKERSIFKNDRVERGRRLSIICRNAPLK